MVIQRLEEVSGDHSHDLAAEAAAVLSRIEEEVDSGVPVLGVGLLVGLHEANHLSLQVDDPAGDGLFLELAFRMLAVPALPPAGDVRVRLISTRRSMSASATARRRTRSPRSVGAFVRAEPTGSVSAHAVARRKASVRIERTATTMKNNRMLVMNIRPPPQVRACSRILRHRRPRCNAH
jgi:hypothetical protein